jgi:hypothetical protein
MDPDICKSLVYKTKVNQMYLTLLDLLLTWRDFGYLEGSSGTHLAAAMMDHAHVVLAMPEASLDEMIEFLEEAVSC